MLLFVGQCLGSSAVLFGSQHHRRDRAMHASGDFEPERLTPARLLLPTSAGEAREKPRGHPDFLPTGRVTGVSAPEVGAARTLPVRVIPHGPPATPGTGPALSSINLGSARRTGGLMRRAFPRPAFPTLLRRGGRGGSEARETSAPPETIIRGSGGPGLLNHDQARLGRVPGELQNGP